MKLIDGLCAIVIVGLCLAVEIIIAPWLYSRADNLPATAVVSLVGSIVSSGLILFFLTSKRGTAIHKGGPGWRSLLVSIWGVCVVLTTIITGHYAGLWTMSIKGVVPHMVIVLAAFLLTVVPMSSIMKRKLSQP